ncbi:MAG: Mur ligase family protein [Peptoniphilaceae bacterium]
MFYFIVISILLVTITGFLVSKRSHYPMNMLQLEGYENSEYKVWIQENEEKVKRLVYPKITDAKSPLVWTERAKRLKATHDMVNSLYIFASLAISILIYYLSKNMIFAIIVLGVSLFVVYYLQFQILLVSNKIALPKEEIINKGFFDSAQAKILEYKNKENLKVLGITGSFGKTSVKFIANTVLAEALKVKNTPSSFNTPMGLSKIINNELERDREVFIAELGAKKKGEIEEVANLVRPDIGIITAIGPTHMHLFKSIENIMDTKYELIEALPKDGVAIFNYDNEYVKVLSDKTSLKKINYGIKDIENLDVYAKDIEVSSKGSQFTLGIKELGEVKCESILLGVHNISNLLAAASAAYVLGLSLDQIASGIKKVEAVEHRLNIVDSGTGVIVIDDAFNSNPVGFRAALDVIDGFKDSRKIIITPGMVELGDIEEEENYKIGFEIAKVCDFVILVGKKRTEAIYKGLKEAKYQEENIFVVNSLNEATAVLGNLSRVGDVVLFENDLPDNYNEE